MGQTEHQNRFLAALTGETLKRMQPHLQQVTLKYGEQLYTPGETSRWAYFPVGATLVSLLAVSEDGNAVEVAITGSEGVVGVWNVLGPKRARHECLVQNAGAAVRISVEVLRGLVENEHAVRRLLLRYSQLLFTQVAQTALCNRLHSAEERMARWLLMTQDRAGSGEFRMTHELLAKMLGTRRSTVSLTASVLQRAGMLRYKRGHMSITDRKGLHGVTCGCYDVVRREVEGLYRKDTE
jgi:CRP-like cAMP-binding protein